MIGDPEQQEVWYQANLDAVRQNRAWRKEIDALRNQREALPGLFASLQKRTKTELAPYFHGRGPELAKFARDATRLQLIGRRVELEQGAIDVQIAHLEQKIADNQPSPLWRIRDEDASLLDREWKA